MQFFEQTWKVRNVLNHIVHPDLFHRIIVKRQLFCNIRNDVYRLTVEGVDPDKSFFCLISTPKI